MQPDKCRISWCERERVRDALFCSEHLNDAWANRVVKLSDGTHVVGAGEPFVPEWRKHLTAKDYTRSAV